MSQYQPKQHSPRFQQLAGAAKMHIKELTPAQLKHKLDNGEPFYLIDVREESEYKTGFLPTAIHLSKGIIERDIEKSIPDAQAEIVVYCSGGFRSALVAESLQKMGYTNVYSVYGGLSAWLAADYPIVQK